MITARQFKGGFVIEVQKILHLVMSAQHIKPGKGGAFVRAKLKNLQTGAIAEKAYRPEEAFPRAYIEQKKMQFLYKNGSTYHFMDQSSYEQIGVEKDMVGTNAKFLKDGTEVTASFHKDSIIAIELSPFVNLKVTYTEPGIKGDTAKGGSKPATLETGAIIRVPLFVNTDDIIKIDTRTTGYAGRV